MLTWLLSSVQYMTVLSLFYVLFKKQAEVYYSGLTTRVEAESF